MKSDVTRRVHTIGIQSVIFIEQCIVTTSNGLACFLVTGGPYK